VTTVSCPNGHRFRGPRVAYGLPTPELMAAAEHGQVLLGGCDPGAPVELPCPNCGEPVVWSSEGLRLGVRPPEEGGTDRV
jgi:hypothetical protein